MEMTQVQNWYADAKPENISPVLVSQFLALLNNPPHEYIAA
jgi:lipoyl(octanoyl) transferase